MRRALDQYYTPGWATEVLLENAPEVRGDAFLECCVGKGDISRVLIESNRFPGGAETNDADKDALATFHGDATGPALWRKLQSADWVVSNPPFSLASAIIPRAYDFAGQGIAMLLRLSYLEPCFDRDRWLAAHAPTRLIILPRISFTGNGKTDNVTCAWFVWEKRATITGQKPNVSRANPIVIVPRPAPAPNGQLSLSDAVANL